MVNLTFRHRLFSSRVSSCSHVDTLISTGLVRSRRGRSHINSYGLRSSVVGDVLSLSQYWNLSKGVVGYG